MIFNDEFLEFKTNKNGLKLLATNILLRNLVIIISFGLIYFVNADLVQAYFIFVIPLLFCQVWLDKKFIAPKLALLFAWISCFYLLVVVIPFFGLIGLVLSYVMMFLYYTFRINKKPLEKIENE